MHNSGNHRTDSAVKVATGLSIPVAAATTLAYSIYANQGSAMRGTLQLAGRPTGIGMFPPIGTRLAEP